VRKKKISSKEIARRARQRAAQATIRLAYRPIEVAEALGISLRKVNDLIATGELESFKVDRCRRITPDAVAKLIHSGEAA
jgi:excisionase family DNA binding protein